MDDTQIACYVADAVGCSAEGLCIERLRGAQGLLICRVRTRDSRSYVFKVVPASRRREIALTARLAALSPATTVGVVASEEDERREVYWLVMRDLGVMRLADRPSGEGFTSAAESLARLQLETLTEAAALRDLGVREVGVSDWEEIALLTLESAERADLAGLVPLRELEAGVWNVTRIAIDAAALPSALVHGDLHAGNIAICGGEIRLLDWGSAYIGPAFLALEELLLPAANHLKRACDLDRVSAAYMRAWTPQLGRPGRLDRPRLACRTLVRLQVLSAAIKADRLGPPPDPYIAATAFRRFHEACSAWSKAN